MAAALVPAAVVVVADEKVVIVDFVVRIVFAGVVAVAVAAGIVAVVAAEGVVAAAAAADWQKSATVAASAAVGAMPKMTAAFDHRAGFVD